MHFSSNPMSNKLAHDGKAKAARFILNFGANVANAPAFAGDADGADERIFRYAQQLVCALIDDSNRHGERVVPYPAILNDANIQFYDVAILNAPLAADAVHDFIVKRNTNVP